MQQETKEKNVLIVEENDICFLLMNEYLTPLGFNLHRAIDDIETWNLLNSKCDFCFLVMGVRLRCSINGFDLAKEVKKKLPELPIIIQTAMVSEKKEPDSMPGIYDAYLTKPYNDESFLEKVFSIIPEASN